MVNITTSSGRWDTFPQSIAAFLAADVSAFEYEGRPLRGYRSPDTKPIWIRDHTWQLQFARYLDTPDDLWLPYEFLLSRPRRDGSFWEWVLPGRPLKRISVEADVEYIMAIGVHMVWQATGDDDRMARALPVLEAGLHYSMSHPWRWSAEHGLIKRAFTIDTWDFQYLGRVAPDQPYRSDIGPFTRFGIMHGDNSGLYAAARRLAAMRAHLGDTERAACWNDLAERIRARLNALCWNGRFYRHVLHIDPCEVPGLDEEDILSLSNTYDINRGVASQEQAALILDEYARRGRELNPRPFAPWFTVQPCFPDGSFGNLSHAFGEYRYINGGLMPFVGGELALAALAHGRERFGVDQLDLYARMLRDTGKAFFCYRYDGQPDLYNSTIVPTDGWGSSAMANALVSGLAGVVDESTRFRDVRLSPRWPAAGEDWAEVSVAYHGADASVAYRQTVDRAAGLLTLDLKCGASTRRVHCHILLPDGAQPASVDLDGKPVVFQTVRVESSAYADLDVQGGIGIVRVRFT